MLPQLRARRLAILALYAVLIFVGLVICLECPRTAMLGFGIIPLLGTVAIIPEEEFQTRVLKGMEGIEAEQKKQQSRFNEVAGNLDNADKEVKKALEDLTKVKNTVNDFDLAMKEMRKVQTAIEKNVRSSWRNPVEKLLSQNEELGVFLNAVARMGILRAQPSQLPEEMRKVLEDCNAKSKALTGVDTSLGQATIPSEWFKTIYDTLQEYGDYASLDVVSVGARTNLIPVATSRPGFYWIGSGTGGTGEGSAITEGSLAGSSVTLSIQTIGVYLLAARELLADASTDMAPYIMKQMLQSLAFGLDTAAFIGSGAADQTNGGYIGIFNAASANTNLASVCAPGNTTVEATQLEDWQNVLLTVSPMVLKRSARWWMHPQMLIRALAVRDANRRPLFQTYTEAPMPGGIGNILGYPVGLPSVAPTTNAPGYAVAAFGEPEGQAVGLRQDMEFATSDDIKFAENMRAFRCLARAGVKLKTLAASNTLKPLAVMTLAAN